MNQSHRLLAGLALAALIASAPPGEATAADYANPHMLLSPATLNEMLARADVRVIDVRPKTDYEMGHIPKALSIPADAVIDPTAHVHGARYSTTSSRRCLAAAASTRAPT